MAGFPIKWVAVAVFIAVLVLLSIFTLLQNRQLKTQAAPQQTPDTSLSDRDWEFISVLALDVESQTQRIDSLLQLIQSLNASMTKLQQSVEQSATAVPHQDGNGELVHFTLPQPGHNETVNQWDEAEVQAEVSDSLAQSTDVPPEGQLLMLGKQSATQSTMAVIPAGSMALETFLLTALIGRVPDQNAQVSTLPFKVMINGSIQLGYDTIQTPFFGAVAMGFATGDFLLSCAIANIYEISLNQAGKYYFARSDSGEPIGYLTTANGNTCLPGKLVTTVPKVIGGSALLAGVAGWTQNNSRNVLSDLPTNSTVNLNGPSALDFASNQALQSVLADTGSWWYDKLQNQWDAVIVPSGEKTILHFSQNLVLKQLANTPQ